MRPRGTCVVLLLAASVLISQTGCQSGAPGARFLSFFGLSKKPVVIALVPQPGVLDPFAPYQKLREALSDSMQRPVQLRLCFPFQLEPNLNLGFHDFAFVSPACYASLKDPARFEIVAASVDQKGRSGRSAVLVVPAETDIEAVADLRNKKVAFGPRGDSLTHLAGLTLLHEHGVEKEQLATPLLPIPGLLRHMKMSQVAQGVIDASFDAGFMDEDAFEALPETSDVDGEPTRSRLRALARTVPLPDTLLICSPKVERETVRQVSNFLFSAEQKHREVLQPLLLSAYQPLGEKLRASCERLRQPKDSGSVEPESTAAQ